MSEFVKQLVKAKCNVDCNCQPQHDMHDDDKNDCDCDACFVTAFACVCGHTTCMSPYGGEVEFTKRALDYYRYCLNLESDDFEFSNFSPVEYLEDQTNND